MSMKSLVIFPSLPSIAPRPFGSELLCKPNARKQHNQNMKYWNFSKSLVLLHQHYRDFNFLLPRFRRHAIQAFIIALARESESRMYLYMRQLLCLLKKSHASVQWHPGSELPLPPALACWLLRFHSFRSRTECCRNKQQMTSHCCGGLYLVNNMLKSLPFRLPQRRQSGVARIILKAITIS